MQVAIAHRRRPWICVGTEPVEERLSVVPSGPDSRTVGAKPEADGDRDPAYALSLPPVTFSANLMVSQCLEARQEQSQKCQTCQRC